MRIRVVDSHTGGEPTRVIVGGAPDLGGGDIREKRDRFSAEFDWLRTAVVNEPRGSDIWVGALLLEPSSPDFDFGVIFFNNAGMLNMCGHGTIGLAETLRKLNITDKKELIFETVAGPVKAKFVDESWVQIENVPAYVLHESIEVRLDSGQTVTGDIAWGGNWFFICENHGLALDLSNVDDLTNFAWEIRGKVNLLPIETADLVDHIELVGESKNGANAKNFVLCPGKAYDRSPCGTGTSAKLACLAAHGTLAPGDLWRQESITGSIFEAKYEKNEDGTVLPFISGQAWVTAESTLWLEPDDPLKHGVVF